MKFTLSFLQEKILTITDGPQNLPTSCPVCLLTKQKKRCSVHLPPGVGCTPHPCTASSSFASSLHCWRSRVVFRDWGSHSSPAQNPAKRQIRLQKPPCESAAEAVEAAEAAPSGLTNQETGDESLHAPPSSLSLPLPFHPAREEQDASFASRTPPCCVLSPRNFPLNASLICQASIYHRIKWGGGEWVIAAGQGGGR